MNLYLMTRFVHKDDDEFFIVKANSPKEAKSIMIQRDGKSIFNSVYKFKIKHIGIAAENLKQVTEVC